MDSLVFILGAFSAAIGTASATLSVGQWLVGYLRDLGRQRKTAEVLEYLKNLGLLTEADIDKAMKSWNAPASVTEEQKTEMRQLLINLIRGARFHTTNGTPRSIYLRCERLIEDLLRNVQPKRKAGEAVSDGVPDWKLDRFLGKGSFGEVWVAHNKWMPERRAVKFFTEADGKDWIQREASALSQIKVRLGEVPNVVRYLDIGVDVSPHPYLMLEYVPAGSLEEWILSPDGDRAPVSSLEIMEGIARGLAEAHQNKIYHRDLKPANVLLTNDNPAVPKITDFGLSRVEAMGNKPGSSASQATLVGTSMYLPPEASDLYTPRSHPQDDVFAFGIIWFQVLIGCLERPAYDYAEQLRESQADSRTIRLLSRCLSHPSRRFKDGGELLRALEEDRIDDWIPPEGCFDVGPLVREYLDVLSV